MMQPFAWASLQSEAAQQAQTLDADALQRLTELLCSESQSVAEVAARILARCCHDASMVHLLLCLLPSSFRVWCSCTARTGSLVCGVTPILPLCLQVLLGRLE